MNAFGIAVDVLFTDANLRKIAVYMPLRGTTKTVSVIPYNSDVFMSVGDSFIATPVLVIEVRITDCPEVTPGDRFLISNKTYTVQGEAKRQSNDLTYRIDLA